VPIVMRRLGVGFRPLRYQNRSARSNRRGSVALDPRAEIMGRVLMAVFIRITELMVQFEGGKERRKCHQAQPEHGDKQICEETTFHHITTRVHT
jgi:hypothetical protein